MAYKTILIIPTNPAEVLPLIDAALPMVRDEGAHLNVLAVGIDRTQAGYYFSGATALMHDEMFQAARAEATEMEAAARHRLKTEDVGFGVESAVAQMGMVSTVVARRARFVDLVVLSKPYGPDLPHDAPAVVEAALFQGNVPVMVMPKDTACSAKAQRVVVGWNDSPEAMTAIRAAMPILRGADLVDVLIVDPPRHEANQADPGADLSAMLSRHGAKVEVSIVAQTTPQISETIARHCADRDADLLVMGAYGHSRFREAILGGATRNLLEHAELPVLMAH